MKKIKLAVTFLVAVAFLATLGVHAEPNKQIQPGKINQRAVTEVKLVPASIPQASTLSGPKQGYRLVTDILDGFGGESESDNYRIEVNSGGQPSAIGISESDNYMIEAGYVHASFVMRGDANGDGIVDIGDVIYLINYLFTDTSAPCPMEAGDNNCDGIVDIGDVIYLINYLFTGTSPPGNL
jgi:hypothetical protein